MNSHLNLPFPLLFHEMFWNLFVHRRLKVCVANTYCSNCCSKVHRRPQKYDEISKLFLMLQLSNLKISSSFSGLLRIYELYENTTSQGVFLILNSLSICPSLVNFESCDHDLLNSTQTDRRDQIENALN